MHIYKSMYGDTITLLVFGGTGNVGQQLIRQALGRGHHVRAVVRPVALVDGDPTGEVAIVTPFQKRSKVMTGDVAVWMLDAVERSMPFVQKTEMIASFR